MYTRWTLRCKIFSCTCTHPGRYVVRSSLPLVLSVHYIHKNPGLSSIMSALARFRKYAENSYTPVSRVFSNAPWEWKKYSCQRDPAALTRHTHIQEWKKRKKTKKNTDYQDVGRSQTVENTANTNTKHTWVILTGVSQRILTLFNKKTCMSKQKTPKTQVKWTISCNSHCWQTPLVLQLKRTKKISSVTNDVVHKMIHM